jgi:cytidine deaminase
MAAMDNGRGVRDGAPRYGAAVLTEDGNIHGAGSYQTETRQISLHAEQAALVHASAHGEHEIRAIALVSEEDPSGEAFTHPCGICKQALYESAWASGLPMQVVLVNGKGRWAVHDPDELIVFPWPYPKPGEA